MQENPALDMIIEFTGCEIWQQDHLVLSDVSFRVDKGEFIYLVGRVGSGKSSLIKTINAQVPLKKGEGIVAGFDLSKLKERDVPLLRRKLGIVFQDFQLLTDRNVYDNLEFVLKATGWKEKKNIDIRIMEVLDKVGLSLKSYKMPHQLSGGEQQRVYLARALAQDTPVLLLDEPTAHLDLQYQINLMKRVHALAHPTEAELDRGVRERAVLVAMHDLNLLSRFADRVILLENGKIVAAGTPVEVLDPVLLSKVYRLPLSIVQDEHSGQTVVIPDL